MKQQVNFVYDFENDPVDELKHWLFLENVRINQENQSLEEERERLKAEKEELEKEKKSFEKLKKEQINILDSKNQSLKREKELFEKKWALMENELRRIALDNERIEKEKAYIAREKSNIEKNLNSVRNINISKDALFFAGVTTYAALKKRYRELMKIYHPDNVSGDSAVLEYINKEYEKMKSLLVKSDIL